MIKEKNIKNKKFILGIFLMDFFERYLFNLRNKTKSKFLFFGIINFLITQIILGLTLLFLPVYVATFISQTTNVFIGYFIYSRYVFDFKKKYSSKNFILYSYYAIFIWIINWFTIYFINFYFNINKNLIAILILPILVIFSYLVQKNIIFKNKN